MANARTRKLELERAKRTKAAQKRERRQDKATEDEAAAAAAAEDPTTTEPDPRSDVEVLTSLQLLHERFANNEMAFDDFEEAKNDLMQKLDVR